MGVWEVISLLIFIGTIICTMYYCYFLKMKRMEQALGLDYRDQRANICFQRDETRPNDGEIYTITAGGLILRETRADLRQCTVVRRDSKIVDLPPSYEEALRNTNDSRNPETVQNSRTIHTPMNVQTTSALSQ